MLQMLNSSRFFLSSLLSHQYVSTFMICSNLQFMTDFHEIPNFMANVTLATDDSLEITHMWL